MVTCPECGSGRVVPIVYGMPAPELVEQAGRGDVELGGCCLMVDEHGRLVAPDRSCRACGHDFTAPPRRPAQARPPLV
ncbi:hypothetical protein GCM10027212_07430 [Actinotalea caeni]